MNKFIGLGRITEIRYEEERAKIKIETTDEALTGGTKARANPPVIIATTECFNDMPKDLKPGDHILVTGHYEHVKGQDNKWHDYIVGYCVTKNLSLNLFFGSGNLGADAEVTPKGKACTMNVACKRYFKGEEHSAWVRSVVFNATHNALKLLHRGQKVWMVGALHQEEYQSPKTGEKAATTSLKVRDWQAA